MRILFNATAALQGTSGAVHTIGLLTALSSLAPQHEFTLLTTPEQDYVRDRLGAAVTHHVDDTARGGGLRRTLHFQFAMRRIAARAGVDLIYNKGNFYAAGAGPQVCFIENSNPFSTLRLGEPTWYRTRNRLLRAMSAWALTHAAAVIFPTEHAKRLIVARAKTNVPAFVVPYGWELPVPSSVQTPKRPYLLCVSSVFPYKNLPLLVDACDILRRQGVFDGDLVIVGVSRVAGATYYDRALRALIESRGLSARVRIMPPVPPDELAALYVSAACLVMPSLEESFGIPVIEAMGLGTPVAAARVESDAALNYFIPFEEICADAAEYFDPFDPTACAAAIERVLVPSRRVALIDAGRRRAALYSWRSAAERTLKVFDAAW
jgi:glycosyltransferase involved in cell wall biosynthesis